MRRQARLQMRLQGVQVQRKEAMLRRMQVRKVSGSIFIYCLALGTFHVRASSEMHVDDGHDNQGSVEVNLLKLLRFSTNITVYKYYLHLYLVSRTAFTTVRAKPEENESIYI